VPDQPREGATAAAVVVAQRSGPPVEGAPVAAAGPRGGRLRLGAIGISGGFLSGLLGVGGGVIMVPLLVLWARFSQRDAHAISLGAIIPISAAGALTFGAAGEVQLGYGLALALGAILGAQVGARALVRAPERLLKLTFGVFVLVAAVALAVEA
jgi:uncharacterized membrane protein YfcA